MLADVEGFLYEPTLFIGLQYLRFNSMRVLNVYCLVYAIRL